MFKNVYKAICMSMVMMELVQRARAATLEIAI